MAEDKPLTTVLRVQRGGPDGDIRHDTFEVPFNAGDTVLDGLIWIRENEDDSLALRYSCVSTFVCKQCTMLIDGETAYACKTRLRAGPMQIGPLRGKQVIRDLVADTLPKREHLKLP
ncbi:MAG: 2Fe-2S iron-sulfur cluster-binding protein [Alphaproteobacteria bacterium]|jgi:succinate dehydrogenase/fumarate reductase-like Fe-S protein|nr:2Fe-2S iron-sulfur cluster-binding protein [Alphaproteobacteria bacterium]